eukprot:g4450.t1
MYVFSLHGYEYDNVDGVVGKSSWPRYHGSQSATTRPLLYHGHRPSMLMAWFGKAHGQGIMEVNLPQRPSLYHGHLPSMLMAWLEKLMDQKVLWKSICHDTAIAVSWTSTISVDGMIWKSSWPRYDGSQSATTRPSLYHGQ